MADWRKLLIAGLVGVLPLGFAIDRGLGEEMIVDVSQVNGLPQKLQALQDQINSILAALPKTYATTAALAGLQQQLQAIQLTPGPQGEPGPPGPAGLNCLDDPNCKAYVDVGDATLNLKILNTATTLTARLTEQTVVVEDAKGLVVGPVIDWSPDKAEPIVSVTALNGWVFNAIATANGLSTVGLPFVITNKGPLSTPPQEEAQVFFESPDCLGQAYIKVADLTSDGSAAAGDVTPFSIGAWTPTRIYLTTPGGSPSLELRTAFKSGWGTAGLCVNGVEAFNLSRGLFKTAIHVAPTPYALPFTVK